MSDLDALLFARPTPPLPREPDEGVFPGENERGRARGQAERSGEILSSFSTKHQILCILFNKATVRFCV